jgi:hypothetical protein
MAEIKLELSSVATTNGYDIQVWASAVSGSKDITSVNLRIQFDPAYSNIKLSGSDPVFVLSTSASSAFPISFGDTSIPNTFTIGASAMTGKLTVSTTPVLLATASFDNVQGTNDFVGSLSSSTEIYKDDTLLALDSLPTIDTVEAAVSQIAITDATGDISGLLNAGDTVTATVTANKAVTVDTTNGTPTLKLDVGGVEKTATYSSGSGSTSLLFTYTVQSGDTDVNGISIGANALALNGGAIKDGANNNAIITSNEVAANSSYKVDNIAPTATIALADSALLIGDTFTTVTITFSEAVTGFANSDLAVQGGTLSAVTSTDGGITWTGTLTPTANLEDATNVITLASTYTDVAGNAGTTATSANYVIDLKAPTTPTIVFADTALKVGETSLVTITFNEAITGFANGDLTVQGGTLSTVASTDGGITWTATFTPTVDLEDTTNVVTLANTYTDVAGNGGVGATSANYSIDTVRPEIVSITPASLNSGNSQLVTITLNEAVTNFAVEDIASKIGTIDTGSFTKVSDTVYTISLSATEAISDVAGNFTFTTDWTDAAGNQPVFGPTVAITFSDYALKIGDTSTVTFTFSAAPKNTDGTDITAVNINALITSVENGALGAFTKVSDIVYTATLTPASGIIDTTNKITVGTNWKDAANLPPTGTTDSPNYVVDTFRPTATIVVADTALKAGETPLVTITFSEAVTEFDNSDLIIANGLLSNVVSTDGGTTWTATLTPTADITDASNGITLANTGVTDIAGNVGAGTTDSNNYAIDTTAPTATIVVADTALKAGETSLITITFSEAVTSFDNADLTVQNGTLTNVALSDGGVTWTATLTPTASIEDTTNVIMLANTGVTDASGNAGAGATDSNNYVIDTLAPAAPALVAEQGSTDLTDNLLNSAEAVTTTFRVTLPASGSTAVVGDSVELLLGGVSFSTANKVTLDATAVNTNGYVDFTVLLADLGSDGAKALISKITDAAGNSGAASSAVSFTLDTTAPANTISGIHVGSGNTAVDGMLSAELVTGETLWAAIGSNPLEDITNSSVSAKTIAWVTAVPAGDTTVKFEVRDAAGNATSRSAGIAGNITTTTTTISDTGSATLTAPDGNPIPAAVLVTGSSNEQILLAAMPPGLSLVVKEIANSADTTLDAKLTDSLNALPTSEVNVNAVQAGIDSYLATLLPGDQANVVVRTIEFPASTELLSAPTANQLVINGSTAGNEALVIDTRNLPDGSVLDLQNVEFAIIIGDNVTIRGGAGSNVVYAGSGRQDIKLGVLDDTIHGGAGDDTIASTSGDDWLYGDDGNDSVSGGDDDDHLFGGANNDTLNGEAGNDTLEGGDGDDNIDGGAGSSDKAVFSGYFSDYTITRLDATHFKIVDTKASDGDDGTDIITNVEYFQFLNGTYNQDNAVDTTPPTLESVSPDNSGIAVAVGSNLVFTFSENVQTTGGVVVHVGSVTGEVVPASATVSGKILTIDPVSDLSNGTHYYVTFADGSVHDLYGHSYSAGTYDFTTAAAAPVLHDLTGAVTFWKTGVAMTDVTSAFTSTPVTAGIQFVEFRNIQVSADGARTLEIWETSTKTNSNSLQLEFALPTGSVATWQNDSGLPSGWTSLINTGISGKFVLGGMGITALSAGTVKLGTLMLTAPVNPQHFDLSLRTGWLGNDSVPLFGVALDSMTTGADGICQHINMPDGTYVLTSAKGSGLAEADAVTAIDALAALKMAVGMNPNTDGSAVSSYQFLAADVNKDGIIRAADALNILKMAVKLDSAPAQEWLFVPEIVGSESMSRNQVIWPDNPIPVSLDVDQDLHLIGIVKGDVDGSWAVG